MIPASACCPEAAADDAYVADESPALGGRSSATWFASQVKQCWALDAVVVPW